MTHDRSHAPARQASLSTPPRFGTRLAGSGRNSSLVGMQEDRSSSLEEDRIRDAYARRPKDNTLNTWSNASFVFRVHERERLLLERLTRYGFMPIYGKRVLEVGCGSGSWLREFIQWGARPEHVYGVDLLPDRIAAARRRL